jgi:hypothetical protein
MRHASFGSISALFAAVGLTAGAASAGVIPPAATDLGTITGDFVISGSIAPNEVLWYRFVINQDAAAGLATYFDVTTNDSGIDTELGLYDAMGNRVANDDDDGIGLTSTLTFGSGSGLMLGDSFNLGGDGIADGEDGALLSAGEYYLAFGEFNVTFNDTDFDVVSTGFDTGGDFQIAFFTNVPAPGAAALLGMGGLFAARRRR